MTRVMLLSHRRSSYTREILLGAYREASEALHWRLELVSDGAAALSLLDRGGFDGVVGHFDPSVLQAVHARGVPMVATILHDEGCPFPVVTSDDRAVGRLAAEHLLERGVRRFLVVGWSGPAFGWRCTGFREVVEASGAPCERLDGGPSLEGFRVDQFLACVRSGGGTLGVFAVNDARALGVVQTARDLGLKVPEELAVVGAMNDELACQMAPVAVTSVALQGRAVGRRAVRVLAGLLGGVSPEPRVQRLPPARVVPRRSSEVWPTDEAVAAAMRTLREGRPRAWTVAELAESVALGRRALERRFRAAVGRSPGEEIRRFHVEKARELLAETDLSLSAIARRCGVGRRERLSRLIREAEGVSPGVLRRRLRGQSDGSGVGPSWSVGAE